MARQLTKFLTLLVLALAVFATVYAQGPSDTNNTGGDVPVPTPPTVTPRPLVPTPPPTPPQPATPPTPTTKKTPGSVASKDGSNGGAGPNGAQPKTPKPTPTTRAPGVTPPPAAAAATPPPAITTVSPGILLDRTVKSEYGTRSPAANETTTATNPESTASKMGSWLVPAVIGAVIVSALIFMTFFMRNRRDGDEEDHQTPRRSDAFFEHPKTNTHQAPHVPVLGDHVKSKSSSEKDQSSMRTVAVGGAHHSPRANRVASTDSSPGFPTYKQKTVEGSSVIF